MRSLLALVVAALLYVTLCDAVKISDLQYVGTWDSVREFPSFPAPEKVLPDFRWSMPSLHDQLMRGVRFFRFQMWKRDTGKPFIANIPPTDVGSSCDDPVECMQPIVEMVRMHKNGPPVYVYVDFWSSTDTSFTSWEDGHQRSVLEPIISTYGRNMFYTSDDFRGDHVSVGAARRAKGFPTLAETRGKIILLSSSVRTFEYEVRDDGSAVFNTQNRPWWYLPCGACPVPNVEEYTLFRMVFADTVRDPVKFAAKNPAHSISMCHINTVGGLRFDLSEDALDDTTMAELLLASLDVDNSGGISRSELDLLEVQLASIDKASGSPVGTTAGGLMAFCKANPADVSDNEIILPELLGCAAVFKAQRNIDLFETVPASSVQEAVLAMTAAIAHQCNVLITNSPMPVPGERRDFVVPIGSPACLPHIAGDVCMRELLGEAMMDGRKCKSSFNLQVTNNVSGK